MNRFNHEYAYQLLQSDRDKSMNGMAAHVGRTRRALLYVLQGDREPKLSVFLGIAEYLDVKPGLLIVQGAA